MRSQYGTLRERLGTNDWEVTAVSGGGLAAGTIELFIQSHNRVGLNLLSDGKTVNIAANQKLVVNVNSSAIASGEDVFKFVVSARIGAGAIVQLAEIAARETDNITYKSFPRSIELTNTQHIDTNITQGITSGVGLIHGQVRKEGAAFYRYDSIAARGAIEASPGYWVLDAREGFTDISSTLDTFGCNVSTEAAVMVYPANLNGLLQTEPIAFLWANNLPSNIGNYSAAGTRLNLSIKVNGATATNTAIPYSSFFSDRIQVNFKGYIDLDTGELDSNYPNTNAYVPWNNLAGLILPADVPPNTAAAYDIIIDFSHPALAVLLSQGTIFELDLIEELTASRFNPAAPLFGDLVTNDLNLMRVVPQKLLSGRAIIKGFEFTYNTESVILGLAPDTTNQKVIISADRFGVVQVKDTVGTNEAVRALVGTSPGTQTISPWYSEPLIVLDSTKVHTLTITLNFPIDEQGKAQVRTNYPDVIAGNTLATFNVPEIIIYLKNVITGNIYKFNPVVTGVLPQQIITINSFANAGVIEEEDLPSNTSDFGLFGYIQPTVASNEGSGSIEGSDYHIALAYHYPEDNYQLTSINHSPSLGCIPEINTTLINVLNDASYWLAPVANLHGLKSINHTSLKHGAVVYLLESKNLYWFNAFSVSDVDEPNIVKPTTTEIGRFEILSQSSGTLLGELASQIGLNRGALLTIDADGNEIILPAGNNGQILSRSNSSPTGLAWIENTGGSNGNSFDITGVGPNRLVMYDDISQLVAKRLYLNESVDNLSDSKCLLLTQRTTAQQSSILTHVAPPILPGVYSLTYNQNTTAYTWARFSIAGLSDTYNDGTIIEHGSQLVYDSADGKWKPALTIKDTWLGNLKDVFIDNNIEGYPLVWDNFTQRYIVGLPDLTSIDGLIYTTEQVPVLGDDFFNNTKSIVSARVPGQDLKENAAAINVVSALLDTATPYVGGAGSYYFNRGARRFIQIPTNGETLLGNNNFCIELWFRSTELLAGQAYTIASRNNSVQTDFTIFLTETSVGTFNIKFFGEFTDFNGQRQSLIELTSNINGGAQINNWYHIAVTRNGNNWRLFVNGTVHQLFTGATDLTTSFSLLSAVFICLGRINNTPFADSAAFVGNIEDFRLTVGNARYINTFTPPTQPLPITAGGFRQVKHYSIEIQSATDFYNSTTPNDGEVLTWSSSANKFKLLPIGEGGEVVTLSLGQITDVDLTGAQEDYFLGLNNSGVWVAKQIGTGVTSINGASGVVTLTTDDITQGTVNKYLTPGEIAVELGNVNLEVLGNVATTIANNMFLQKVNGVWQGTSITSPVVSVNGLLGAVSLNTGNIPEVDNKFYFTTARFNSSIATVTIEDLANVFTTVGTTNQIATLNAEGRITFTFPSTVANSISLGDLNNLITDSAQEGDTLRLNALGQWISTALSTDDLVDGTLTERYNSNKVYTILNSITRTDLPGILPTSGGTTGQLIAIASDGKFEYVDPPSGTGGGGSSTLSGLTDTSITAPTSGQFLRLEQASWINVTLTADMVNETETRTFYTDAKVDNRLASASISSLTGVFDNTGTEGQIVALKANGKLEFINQSSGDGGSSTLSGLTDTTITTPTSGQFLRLEQASWINVTLTADMVDETETRTFYTDAKVDTRIAAATTQTLTGVFDGTGTTGQVTTVNAQGKLAFAPHVPYQQFKDVTGDHTLEASDHGKIIRITDESTITLPSGLTDGFQVTIFNMTNTTITFSTTGTLLSSSTKSTQQYKAVYLTHVSSNNWLALGALDE